jgi:hypothetical protein
VIDSHLDRFEIATAVLRNDQPNPSGLGILTACIGCDYEAKQGGKNVSLQQSDRV